MKDDFGNRMKRYEKAETARTFMPMLPIYARIDGRGFSAFTHGLERPFDVRITRAMIETTKFLVDATHALIGYTQSDEISLVWQQDHYDAEVLFGGKVQKLVSVRHSGQFAAHMGNKVSSRYLAPRCRSHSFCRHDYQEESGNF